MIKDASPVYLTPKLPEGVDEKVVSLTAASGEQVASWDKELEHGLFTYHLLDALSGGGDADGDGQVTAFEAKAYLDKYMTRAARRQHRRVQEASLLGSEGVVLAAAVVDGTFPTRSDTGVPDRVADPMEGTAAVTPKQQPERPSSPRQRRQKRRKSRWVWTAKNAAAYNGAWPRLGSTREQSTGCSGGAHATPLGRGNPRRRWR